MVAIALLLAISAGAQSGVQWNASSTKIFRVDTTGPPNYIAVASWYGNPKEPFTNERPGPTMLDLYELDANEKVLVSSTRIADGDVISDFKAHCYSTGTDYEDKGGNYHRFFPIYFLSMTANGGQHDHTLVWWFDPETLRPRKMLDVLYGDARALDKGRVIENTPVNYISPDEIPKGVKPRRGYLKRTWTFDKKTFEFKPGAWRR